MERCFCIECGLAHCEPMELCEYSCSNNHEEPIEEDDGPAWVLGDLDAGKAMNRGED